MKKLLAALAILGSILGASSALSSPAHAATESHGLQVLATAETKYGDWYRWGGTGPNSFDCSGLVYWAAGKHGIWLPRTTEGMVKSGKLYRVYKPQRGDLAFWYSGGSAYHVELVTGMTWLTTFGERKTGTRALYRNDRYWMPTRYYRFR